jgi:hypothetical protein
VALEEAGEHATLVGHARRGRRAAEHGRRARGRRESRPRRRERARQARGESRARAPRDHASTRRAPRPPARRDRRGPRHEEPTMQDRPSSCNNAGPSRFPTALDETRTSLVSLLEITRSATCATTSAASRREPDAYVASFSRLTCRTLRVALEEAREHATLVGHARRGRRAAEHRCRARGRRESRPRRRECARQARGESRARAPRDHAATRHAPRPLRPHGAIQTRTS